MTARPDLDLAGVPQSGDRIRLGDTGLVVRVGGPAYADGFTLLTGFAKTARDGIGLKAVRTEESCDVVVTNVVVIDPVLGIISASIGIREGRIVAVGRAGNPDTTDDIDVVVGTGTVIVPGEGLIATAGAVDTHVHLLSPRICEAALASGVTSILGQEFGPFWGVGVNSTWGLRTAYARLRRVAHQRGLPRAGLVVAARSRSRRRSRAVSARSRCTRTSGRTCAPSTRRCASPTSTTSRSPSTPTDSTRTFPWPTPWRSSTDASCTPITSRAAAAGTSPTCSLSPASPNVIGSSTNPTLPYGRDAIAEHEAMIVAVHGLRPEPAR